MTATITYGFMADGGFAARDNESGVCAYAYPTSEYQHAALSHPASIARTMLHVERRLFWCHTSEARRAYDAHVSAQLAAVAGVTVRRYSE